MYNNIMMNFKERKSDNNNPNQSSLQKEDAEERHDDGANKEFSCNTWPEKSVRRSEEEREVVGVGSMSLSEALDSISGTMSYSPVTRQLHLNPIESSKKEPHEDTEFNKAERLVSAQIDLGIEPFPQEKLQVRDLDTDSPQESVQDQDIGSLEDRDKGLDPDSLEDRDKGLDPDPLQDSVFAAGDRLVNEERQSDQFRYVPGHRKAFSLPRTLEVVNEDGSISHCPQPVLESPRSTLQRFGVVQIPIQPHSNEDLGSSISSLSNRTGFSHSEASSHSDSGIQSQCGSHDTSKQEKLGLTGLLSKGFSANWKLLSKTGQQVTKLMRRPDHRETLTQESVSSTGAKSSNAGVVSSQALIMQDRPPGLPAKLDQEKNKHSQEVEAILSSMKKKEKEAALAEQRHRQEQKRQEDDLAAATNYWTNTVLPNWDTTRELKKTRELWWRGLPSSVRGRVWQRALDNQLNLTPQLYSILRERAETQIKEDLMQPQSKTSEVSLSREKTLELIALDVSRTFPQLCIFQEGGPYYSHLHNVLGAYVCYRPDLGYVQGMSFIAAILILNLEEDEAFVLFSNLVNRPPLSSFFNMDQQMMSGYYSTFTTMINHHLPAIANHFNNIKLSPDMYLLDWVMTLYGRAAPLDLACRIWDVMFRDGQDFIFKAGLAILSVLKERILAEPDFTEVAQLLSKLPETISAGLLFQHIQDLNLEPRQKSFHSMFSR